MKHTGKSVIALFGLLAIAACDDSNDNVQNNADVENTQKACEDGIDNDEDAATDCDDDDCAAFCNDTETEVPFEFDLPAEADPEMVGKKLTKLFVDNLNSVDTHYKTACAWYGALSFSALVDDQEMVGTLTSKFDAYDGAFDETLAGAGHVDENVFGIVPFEIYLQNGDTDVREVGITLADHQLDNSESGNQRRYATDDMFMVTGLHVQAFRATQDEKYRDFAAGRMVEYLERLQLEDGCFRHRAIGLTPIEWGRGNGWFAVGMAEILQILETDHEHYETIMEAYKKMMAGLLDYQIKEGEGAGLWKQVLDYEGEDNWPETSGTAMFTFAMITGIKNGWLDIDTYGPAAQEAWLALVSNLDENGRLKGISDWCYFSALSDYIDRQQLAGDNHGQAPMLWIAGAFLRKPSSEE